MTLAGARAQRNAPVRLTATTAFQSARDSSNDGRLIAMPALFTRMSRRPCRAAIRANTASVMGLSGGGIYPNISYQTTKGGLVNMTRALAVEWASRGIRVNAVAPTWTKTALITGLQENPELMKKIEALTPLGRLAEPEEIATAILFLASPAAAMITGHVLAVDGGFLAQ